MANEPYDFATRAIHAGAAPDPTTGARSTPIYQTTAYVFDDVDHAASLFNLQNFGYIYSRLTNPTVSVLEERLASLEGGRAAVCAASGHAAQLLAFFSLMEPGDEFIASRSLYGGSITQFAHAFKKFGWICRFVDPADPQNFAAALAPKTKAIFCEALANPGGSVVDIEPIAAIAKAARIPLMVDNTLATPFLCRPFDWGADIVLHSTTKFLAGHGNAMGGAVIESGRFDWLGAGGKFPSMTEPDPAYHGLKFAETFGDFGYSMKTRAVGLRDLGPTMAPLNAFLTITGIETLHLRMARHVANAQPGRRVGLLRGAENKPLPCARQEISAARPRRRVHFWRQRRFRCGRADRRRRRAFQPSCECRRHALADHPPGLDHASPADASPADRGRGRPRHDPAFRRSGGQRRPDPRSRSRVGARRRLSAIRPRRRGVRRARLRAAPLRRGRSAKKRRSPQPARQRPTGP
jgi:O-acetylhomoserine/O-acetylserine sulfhydrylase-like pyridoxal-dependent enzyme